MARLIFGVLIMLTLAVLGFVLGSEDLQVSQGSLDFAQERVPARCKLSSSAATSLQTPNPKPQIQKYSPGCQ